MTTGELFAILLPRLTKEPATDSFLNGVNNAISVISRRLILRNSSLMQAPYSISFSANTASSSLPDGYAGFVPDAPPSISGTHLVPLPPFKYGTFSSTGTPEYYDTRQGQLTLYPTPSAAVTVIGLYQARPSRLTTMSDDLPWYGALDDLLGEAMIALSKTGQWGSITVEWEAFIHREVDKLQSAYNNRRVAMADASLIAK